MIHYSSTGNETMKPFHYSSTKRIICELDAITQIPHYCRELNIRHPLIVTDRGIIDLNLNKSIDIAFKTEGISPTYFTAVTADPSDHLILDAVTAAKESSIDGVIGFGGGSSLDTAKLVALLTQSNQSLEDIYGIDNAKGIRLPLILIPTTAGTGSEVTPIAIVTTGEATKAGIVAQQLLPDIALLDAQLTIGLPAEITAATGIDAMVHAIEAYTSKIKKNVYSDMLAKQALLLLVENIEEATVNGKNLQARQAMLLGSCLAGQAFANAPVAAVHALAYPLGGHYHIPHGLSNSLVLPFVLEFNLPEAHKEYAELATLLLPESNAANTTELAQQFISYLQKLIVKLGLPTSLQQVDIPYSKLETLAHDAMKQSRLLINNPREIHLDNALTIYQSAWQGIIHEA